MPTALFWFRRDLRLTDNTALHHALASCRRVWCVFVFDRDILDPLLARGLEPGFRHAVLAGLLLKLGDDLHDGGSAAYHSAGGWRPLRTARWWSARCGAATPRQMTS